MSTFAPDEIKENRVRFSQESKKKNSALTFAKKWMDVIRWK